MNKYHLLPQQLGIFLEWVAAPTSTQYNIGYYAPLPLATSAAKLQAAIDRLQEVHPEMRTSFVMGDDGEPRQYINPDMHIELKETTINDQDINDYADHWLKPYDLLSGEPLWRIELAHGKDSNYIFFSVHHTVGDGNTVKLFTSEISELYAGKTIEPKTGYPKIRN